MFKPDQPIQSHKEDFLGRAPFAAALGEAILSYRNKESFVIALFGEWGSGKTSTINIALETIQNRKPQSDTRKPIIILFNPWIFSGKDNLTARFFHQMISAFNNSDLARPTARIHPKLTEYANSLTTTQQHDLRKNFQPDLTPEGHTPTFNLQTTHDFNTLRTEIDALFERSPHKVIVIIDDIDRLEPREIKEVFQVIKVCANFPNTLYLLSMDKKVILRALAKVQESSAVEFLEKMIQLPFEIPVISGSEIEHVLLERIFEQVKTFPPGRFNREYWGTLYHAGFKNFFRSIRDVIRYSNAFQFGACLAAEDTNPVDYCVMTALQVFIPEVWFEIRKHKEILTGTIKLDAQTLPAEKEIVEELVHRSDTFSPDFTREILKKLFPRIESLYEGIEYPKSLEISWQDEGRICSPHMFESFFKLAASSSVLARKEYREALGASDSEDTFRETILKFRETGKIGPFLASLESFLHTRLPENRITNIITAILDTGDQFPRDDAGTSGVDSAMRALHILMDLLGKIPSQEKRFQCLETAFTHARNSLYHIVKVTEVLEDEHRNFYDRGLAFGQETLTLNLVQFETLRKITIETISTRAREGKLTGKNYLPYILTMWTRWSGNEEPESFIREQLKNEDISLELLLSFLNVNSEAQVLDFPIKGLLHTNIRKLRAIAPDTLIRDLLEKVRLGKKFEELPKQYKQVIKEFETALREHPPSMNAPINEQ